MTKSWRRASSYSRRI